MNNFYSIGIDLGTSNSALALAEAFPGAGDAGDSSVDVVEVTQVMSPGTLGERKLLPSALYVAGEQEFSPASLDLPWRSGEPNVLGTFAREQGALVPDRLISSAKSWLCNPHVGRDEAILPWRSEIAEPKMSPVDVSALILEHLRESLLLQARKKGTEDMLERSRAVLTVPASFDEVARNLTAEAARRAGWGEVTLLEEPQAAFYAWISSSRGKWRDQVQPGDVVLVCDVGGGTTDFSLIAVTEEHRELRLSRISVGDHILLGGDNMDLALAYYVQGLLQQEGKSVNKWQFLSLVHLARQAKERLLGRDAPEEYPISIAGRGGSLFRDTISTNISREQVERVVLDGFFPDVPVSTAPQERRAAGLQEFGLPYAADAAITKHLARFLTNSLRNLRSDASLQALLPGHAAEDIDFLQPTAVLFNGGVFNGERLRERVLSVLRSWSAGREVRELEGGDLDLAVARGACAFGRLLAGGKGLRIKAGVARSYYIGLESSMPAVPGYRPPVKGLCIVPQGTEEGSRLGLSGAEFGLVTGEPVDFRFFSSTTRAGDAAGAIVEDAEAELEETARLEASIPAGERRAGEVIPVQLEAVVSEVGALELWMVHRSGERWKLEFNLRAVQ